MTHDIIIVGAGPAGMSAAATAAAANLKTAIIDEQAQAGGQIYRNVGAASPEVARILGPDYGYGKTLVDALDRANVDRYFSSSVWDVAADLTVSAVKDGQSFQLRAPQIIVATGAMERPSPMPGWTLPGVLNAGAAQIALKSAQSVPSGRIVLVGGGPLLLLVACQLLDAGGSIAAIVETSPASNVRRALRHAAGAMMVPKLLAKGLGLIGKLRRAGVPWFKAASETRIEGKNRVEGVTFVSAAKPHHVAADVVLLHHGVVPNTQMSRLLEVAHAWNDLQAAWQPKADAFGETDRPGVRIAGDGGGIVGAIAAQASGALAALGAACALGTLSVEQRDQAARAPQLVLSAQQRLRPFLDTLYRPPDWITAPSGDTIVCRCEEVSAAQIAGMAALGCLGPNQAKFFSRCGMGPCQGRVCGLPVTAILARELGKTPDAVGAYRIRSPLKPLPLSAIAGNRPLKAKETQ